jgi:hypothetical protein
VPLKAIRRLPPSDAARAKIPAARPGHGHRTGLEPRDGHCRLVRLVAVTMHGARHQWRIIFCPERRNVFINPAEGVAYMPFNTNCDFMQRMRQSDMRSQRLVQEEMTSGGWWL